MQHLQTNENIWFLEKSSNIYSHSRDHIFSFVIHTCSISHNQWICLQIIYNADCNVRKSNAVFPLARLWFILIIGGPLSTFFIPYKAYKCKIFNLKVILSLAYSAHCLYGDFN